MADSKHRAALLFKIEQVLMDIPGVRAGVAVPFQRPRGLNAIGAYLVVQAGMHLSAERVLEICRQQLGEARSPSCIIFGKDLPLRPDGEVDRAALKSRFV
jgi:acyl-coenzyme A synthetase/AMP-(fatty) acid ligase